MLKKISMGLAVLCVLLGAAYVAYRPQMEMLAMLLMTKAPETPFDQMAPPPAPDYAKPESWAALPGRADAGDVVPAGVVPADEAGLGADVLFVHPTTFFSRDQWNAAADDAKTNSQTDSGTIRHQAGVFNGCCRVFAPRYRQASFAAMVAGGDSGAKAQALATEDVIRAFRYYLEHHNQGRPFILASHSQGSRILRDMIPRELDGRPEQARLVAAYLIGNWLPESWAKTQKAMKICEGAEDTGCVMSWSTVGEDANIARMKQEFARRNGFPAASAEETFICTNPLSWSADGRPAPASANQGGWVHGPGPTARPVVPGVAGAVCRSGALVITAPSDPAFTARVLPGSNFHNYDVQLFYMNIRENAVRRVAAFQRANSTAP